VPEGAADSSTTSWSANVQVSEAALDFATETAMSVDSRGNIAIAAIVFEHYDPTSFESSIGLWLSRDDGQSFSRAYTATGSQQKYLGDPTVLFDNEDRLIVGWVRYDMNGGGDVMIVRSTDGVDFSDPELVDPSGQGTLRDRPWLSLAPDGSVTVSWVAAADFFSTVSKRAISRGGGPFDTVETVAPGSEGFVDAPIAFDLSGGAIAVMDDLTVWRLEGGAWTPVQALSSASARAGVEAAPQVAWTPKAGYTVAFLGPPRFGISLYAIHSLDGRSWSTPEPIAGGAVGGAAAALPWLTADDNGRLHLMWLDNRSGGWVPYAAVSDDGAHFRQEERIGDAAFTDNGDERRWLGDFNTIVARSGRRYAAWADSRGDVQSAIFFSSAPEVP
jgi:hypothetical protein